MVLAPEPGIVIDLDHPGLVAAARDADGEVRLIERTMSWEGYVRLAFDELRLAGAASPQVPRRMRAALEDLKTIAPPERHPPLNRQLALLTAAVTRGYEDEDDLRAALTADQQGIGSGSDLDATRHPAGSPSDGFVPTPHAPQA